MKKIFYTIFLILCTIIISGCNNQGNVNNKYENLSNYLINNGWEKSENSSYVFSLKVRDVLDDEGKPINVDWYNLDTEKMDIQRTTRISQLSATVTNYSLKNNISTGTYILLNENDEWYKYVSFTYDFNSGILTIDDNSSSSLCTSLSIGLKDYLVKIIEDSDLKIEDFK